MSLHRKIYDMNDMIAMIFVAQLCVSIILFAFHGWNMSSDLLDRDLFTVRLTDGRVRMNMCHCRLCQKRWIKIWLLRPEQKIPDDISKCIFLNQFIMLGIKIQHDDVIKWKHFPRYWPFVWGIHRWPVNSPNIGQWRGALMFSLICTWTNGWAYNRDVPDGTNVLAAPVWISY